VARLSDPFAVTAELDVETADLLIGALSLAARADCHRLKTAPRGHSCRRTLRPAGRS